MICLPSERTLCDYRSFKDVVSGVDTEEILNLAKSHPSSDVSILIDEMNIKDGLVYNRQTGMLTGYVDSMDADSLFNSIDTERNLGKPATHAMCFMVGGLQSSVQTVVATFATSAITAEELYIRFWDVVASCELVGIKVRACVSDGASIIGDSTSYMPVISLKMLSPSDALTDTLQISDLCTLSAIRVI